jgi:hypothetical protein
MRAPMRGRDHRAMNASTPTFELEAPLGTARRPEAWYELASRQSGSALVRLFWRPREDSVFVYVQDETTGEDFVLDPPSSAALSAFYHPYASTAPQRH